MRIPVCELICTICVYTSVSVVTASVESQSLSIWEKAKLFLSTIIPFLSDDVDKIPRPPETKNPSDYTSRSIIDNNLDNSLSDSMSGSISVDGVLSDHSKINQLIIDAKALIGRGKLDQKVIDILLSAVDIDSENYEGNFILGTSLLALRKAEMAEGFLFKAATLSNWTSPNAIANLAESLRLTGEYTLAAQVAQRGIENVKDSPEISGMFSFTLASVFLEQKNFSAAAEWYLSTALQQSSNIDAWLLASTLQFPPEHFESRFAENVLLQALKFNPENSQLLFYMGITMQKTNRIDLSLPFYFEALRLSPNNHNIKLNLATSLHSLNRPSEAKKYYDEVLEVEPDNVVLLTNYAQLLSQLGFHSKALGLVQRASVLSPQDSSVISARELCMSGLQSYRTQVSLVQELLSSAVSVQAWDRVVGIAAEFGEPVENGAWWFFSVGMSLNFMGDFARAADYCSIAATLIDGSHLIHGCIGISLKNLGQEKLAAQHFETSYDILNKNSHIVDVIEPIPSLGFYASMQQIEVSLLQSLHASENYDKCIYLASRMANLVEADNRALVFVLAQYESIWMSPSSDQLITWNALDKDPSSLLALVNKSEQQILRYLPYRASYPPMYNLNAYVFLFIGQTSVIEAARSR